jgi:hypothetical protein
MTRSETPPAPTSGRRDAWLLEHSRNVHSQCGEDGVLQEILRLLPDRDQWCVEFGAWDGKHLSNTCRLIEEEHYHAVLIEGNPVKFRELTAAFPGNDRVHPLLRFVGWEGPGTLDRILAETPIPRNFDLLSIDIDGNDWHVWKALVDYRPKVVIIEFNPSMPTELDWVQEPDFSNQTGCSLHALERLGKEKGYELVSVLPWNAVFVDAPYFSRFGIADNRAATLRQHHDKITWLFTGFDGSIVLHGHKTLPGQAVPMVESSMQQLPRFLRGGVDDMSPLRRKMLGLWRRWQRLRAG